MRKFIIDTDTGSDDAAALMLAILSEKADIVGITTLGGNIALEKATANALMTVETCGADIPVYPGAYRPLMRELETAEGIHGKDGMGDRDLIHPTLKPQSKHAVDFILETVRENPDEIEIIALGPATNIALAILTDRDAMKKVKHIYSMGTGGFGPGNATPVAEFNVFVDAEAYATMLDSGIPITIIGFDVCLNDAALSTDDINRLKNSGKCGWFISECVSALLRYNFGNKGIYFADLPDAVAAAVALFPEIVKESVETYCYCCTKEEATYGQVVVYDVNYSYSVSTPLPPANSHVIKTIDTALFKKILLETLEKGN